MIVRQPRRRRLFDREHLAGRQPLCRKGGTSSEQDECVIALERASNGGGYILAETVADHRRRVQPPRHPKPGERVLDDEQPRG